MDRALDGARILWRWYLAAEDREANEGHVREFSQNGDYARVAQTTDEDDRGRWLRCSDVRVVGVLQEKVALTKKPVKPRRRRPDGEGWKDGEGLDLGGDGL